MKVVAISFFAIFGIIFFGPTEKVDARQWRATPTSKALQYVQIIDNRTAKEVVFVQWTTPEIVESTPQNELLQSVLQQYMVILIAHASISNLGEWTIKIPEEVSVRGKNSEVLSPLQTTDLPPGVVGMITSLQNVLSNGLGPMGKGMRTFVFESNNIESCKDGLFWVVYAGEKYEYQTPTPGCP